MPGPMAAWAKSTGAMLPCCIWRSASGNSAFRASTNSRRVATGASAGRGRHTRTMLEARALVPIPTIRLPSSVRIGQVPVTEAGMDHCTEKGFPASTGNSVIASALRLFEGVVDSDRKRGMGLVGKALHRQRHAGEEELLCLLLAAMAIRSRYQLVSLGHGQSGEEIRKHRSQRSTQPDVEEVRKVCVSNIVVVWRIGGDNFAICAMTVMTHPFVN